MTVTDCLGVRHDRVPRNRASSKGRTLAGGAVDGRFEMGYKSSVTAGERPHHVVCPSVRRGTRFRDASGTMVASR
jgi:hypothetical protein